MSHQALTETFFNLQGRGQVWQEEGLSEYLCQYSAYVYNDLLFKEYQLHCPPDILRTVDKRKAAYLAGRYCARQALAPFELADFVVLNAPDRSPIWPNGLLGSISHSDNHAIAVVSDDKYFVGVGTDIEPVVGDDAMREIMPRILNSDELGLMEFNHLTDRHLFTILFSLKESFFKAAYRLVQGFFGFEAISVLALDRDSEVITFRLNQTLHKRLRQGAELKGRFRVISDSMVATLVTLPR